MKLSVPIEYRPSWDQRPEVVPYNDRPPISHHTNFP